MRKVDEMRKRITMKIWVFLLIIALCSGSLPTMGVGGVDVYAEEFSSGEDVIAESQDIENLFSDSVHPDSVQPDSAKPDSEESDFVSEPEILPEPNITEEAETAPESDFTEETEIPSDLEEETSMELYFVNPIYEDTVTEAVKSRLDALEAEGKVSSLQGQDSGIAMFGSGFRTQSAAVARLQTIEEVGSMVRETMKKREETLSFIYKDGAAPTTEEVFAMRDYAMAHTGVPTEGDYLKYQFHSFKVSGQKAAEEWVITWTTSYYVNAEQEKIMDRAVAQVLRSLDLTGKTDYEKAAAIYDYVCSNVQYDYANLNNKEYYLKYTGYAALIDKTAVCQGYAVLMYRLLLASGVDNRIVAGYSYNQRHSWNIIRIGEAYYNADSTWDAGYLTYKYFLKSETNFYGHERDAEYAAESFYLNYPMGTSDYIQQETDISSVVRLVENGIVYKISDTQAIVTDYQGTASHLVIPAEVNGVAICAVADYAFCENETLEVVQFLGNAPQFHALSFWNTEAAVVYPYGNATWTEETFENYAGTLEWMPHGEDVHAWIENEALSVAVTCEKDGISVYECLVCDAEKSEEFTALGHAWSEWETVKANSYEEDGLLERICGNCERQETRTVAKKVLSTPKIVSVKAASGKKIKVSWEAVEGADGYYIYVKTTGEGWALLTSVSAEQTSYSDSTPTAGISYTYTVRAYAEENGKIYSSAYETGKSATAKTAAPKVTVKETSYNKIKITWNKVKDADGYRVCRKTSSGDWKLLKDVSPTVTSYTDKTAVTGTKYYYTVRGYCMVDGKMKKGDYTSSSSITAKTAAPELTSVKGQSYNKIKISWETVSGATGYRVFRRTADGEWKTLKTLNSSSAKSYTDTKAVTGVTYYYTVKSFRVVNGKTVWGRMDEKGLKCVAKTHSPTLVSAKIVSSKKTVITWKPAAGATAYRVYRKTSDGEWKLIKTLNSSTATSYTHTKANGKSYTYTVKSGRKVDGSVVWGYYSKTGIKSKK